METKTKVMATLMGIAALAGSLSSSVPANAKCNNPENSDATGSTVYTPTATISCTDTGTNSSTCNGGYPGCNQGGSNNVPCCTAAYAGYSATLTAQAFYSTGAGTTQTTYSFSPANTDFGYGWGYYDAATIWCRSYPGTVFGSGMWNGPKYANDSVWLGCPTSNPPPSNWGYDSNNKLANNVVQTMAWGWLYGP